MQEFISSSAQETVNYAQQFTRTLTGGEVIGLTGELGSGKTTFVRGLAKALGVKEQIISPTYILVRQYQGDRFGLYHVDLYRISGSSELLSLGLEEIWLKPENIVVIEWAEKAIDALPESTIFLKFGYVDEVSRKIILQRNIDSKPRQTGQSRIAP